MNKTFIDRENRLFLDFTNTYKPFDLIPNIPYYCGEMKQLANHREFKMIKGSRNLDYLIKKYEQKSLEKENR